MAETRFYSGRHSMISPQLRRLCADPPKTTPLTFTIQTPACEVVQAMNQARLSFALVLEQDRLAGIFTERDVVRSIALGQPLDQLSIGQLMTPAVITISESEAQDLSTILDYFQRCQIRHLPVVNSAGQVVNVLCPEVLREALKPTDLLRLRRVAEVMSDRVFHVSPTLSITQAAQIMAAQRISCVVIVDPAPYPIGILTERDLVRIQALGDGPSQLLDEIPVQTVMSHPLVLANPQDLLWDIHCQMQARKFRRMVVVNEQGELAGLITQSSILRSLDPTELLKTIDCLQRTVCAQTEALQVEVEQRRQMENQLRAVQKQLLAANQRLETLAYLDNLTQIPNRRHFDKTLAHEWKRLIRNPNPLALILCDIDYFKRYNDHYGHPAGDHCLKLVATAIAHSLQRPTDTVARYGGEEFVILLPNTNLEGALVIAERIRQVISQLQIPHTASEVATNVTVSLGVASCIPRLDLPCAELITAADQALYQAKAQGRNTCCISSETNSNRIQSA